MEQPGPFCAESARPGGSSWSSASDSRVYVCVCVRTRGVCGTGTAAAGDFTNVKRLSVFVSSGAQLMNAV